MKKITLLFAATSLLAACGEEKKSENTAAASPEKSDTSTATSLTDSAKSVGKDIADSAKSVYEENKEQVKSVGTEIATQTKAVGTEIAEQAKAVASDVKEQSKSVVEGAKTQFNEVKNLFSGKTTETTTTTTNASDTAKTVAQSLTTDAVKTNASAFIAQITEQSEKVSATSTSDIKTHLKQLTSSVAGGDDASAITALQKIYAAKPTEEQVALLSEIKTNVAVLALGRNFETDDAAATGAINNAITAIKAGDTSKILTALQDVSEKVTLTDDQKTLVGNLATTYTPALAEAGTKAKGILDTVKGFGF